MIESLLANIIENNFIIKILPFLILINIVAGTANAVKSKKFKFEALINYIKNGTMFFIFLLLLDLIYYGISQSDVGSMITSAIQTLRGVSWLSIFIYYISKIYKNFVSLGMPKLTKVETELKRNKEEDVTENQNFEGED